MLIAVGIRCDMSVSHNVLTGCVDYPSSGEGSSMYCPFQKKGYLRKSGGCTPSHLPHMSTCQRFLPRLRPPFVFVCHTRRDRMVSDASLNKANMCLGISYQAYGFSMKNNGRLFFWCLCFMTLLVTIRRGGPRGQTPDDPHWKDRFLDDTRRMGPIFRLLAPGCRDHIKAKYSRKGMSYS